MDVRAASVFTSKIRPVRRKSAGRIVCGGGWDGWGGVMGAMAPVRIALLLAAFAAAMFLPVGDGVAAESGRARPPPVYVTCENGECPPVFLCAPGSVWDARARTCRQVSFCPGDRQVQIPGGPCELYCRPGAEVNPFDSNRCRPVFTCPQGKIEKADGVCEILCPDGLEEVAEGFCAARCGEGEELDPADRSRCRIPPAPESCARAGMNYDSAADQCVASPESCATIGKIYEVFGKRCVAATMERCRERGLLYDAAGKQCVVVSAASCGAAQQLYDPVSTNCVATCEEGTEPVGNACLHVCRNNDHNGRFYYDPRARPVFSHSNFGASPPPVERTGGCVCPPGAAGDACRELGRAHGAAAVKFPFAHSLTLANGEFLLGQGVSVGVAEAGPLQWRRSSGVTLSHSELPSVKIFCAAEDQQGNKVPCYDQEKSIGAAIDHAFHGIAVLGILAAKKNGRGLSGVAPESGYLYAWINYDRISLYSDLVTNGASIINNSWLPNADLVTARDFRPRGDCENSGKSETEECLEKARANLQYYARDFKIGLGSNSVFTRDGDTITVEVNELFSAYDYADQRVDGIFYPADRPIYVWAAGNNNGMTVTANLTVRAAPSGGVIRVGGGDTLTILRKGSVVAADSPAVIAGLPYYFPDMTLNNLAVAAVNGFVRPRRTVTADGVTLHQSPIAEFSNRCGKGGASFCLAAPGVAGYENGNAEYAAEYAEAARTLNGGCNSWSKLSNNVYRCRDEQAHQAVLRHLAAEKFRTGLGAGFLLAPETGRFQQLGPNPLSPTLGYHVASGTSFAAPMVSGALALMKSYFMLGTDCGAEWLCGLGSDELVGRILATADRRGIYADASIYGAGLLDVENALTPQGELRLLLGRSVGDSSSYLLSQSGLRPGAALGDSALRALSGVRLAAFDGMNAPFPVFGDVVLSADDSAEGVEGVGGGAGGRAGGRVGGGVGEALRAHQLGFRGRRASPASDWDFKDGYGFLTLQGGSFLSSWGRGGSGGGGAGGSGSVADLGISSFGNPYSALAGDGMVAGVVGDGFRLAMFGEGLGVSRRIRGAFAEFSLAPFSFLPEGAERAGLSFQVGGMEELDGLLDTSGAGVFGRLRARTAFAGLGFSGELPGDWRVRAGGFAGRTAAEDGSGWFSSVEDLWSGAYALGLEREDVLFWGDALGFRVHQPLRASGGLRLRVPTGRTRYGDLTWREVSGGPSGRELIWEGLYRRSSDEGDWLLSAGLISQPGHRADAKTLGRALLAFERAF